MASFGAGDASVPQWEEGSPLSIGIVSADFPEYSLDVADKLRNGLPLLPCGINDCTVEQYDLPSGTPSLSDLQRHHVLLVWTASWTIAGGRSTQYDRTAAGDLLQRYVDTGGRVVQCYGNRPPTGEWERPDGGNSVGQWRGIELAQGVPNRTPLRVAPASHLSEGARDAIEPLLRTLRVGGMMWVNDTAARQDAVVLARWPSGIGLGSPSPSDFITVREPRGSSSSSDGGGGGGNGRVVLLNMYPPSKHAGNASGAVNTLWNPDQTDVAPAMCASLYIAAYPRAVLAATAEEEEAEAEALSFDAFDDAVEAIIHVINNHGVPMWNSGDYAGCARAYHAVASHFAESEPTLAEALAESEGQPDDESFDSRGWILRRALDQVVDQSRSQESLLARERRAAAVLEAEAAARGMNIAGYAQLLEDRRAGIVAAEAEVDKERRGAFREEMEERHATSPPVPKEVAAEKELTEVLARPMLTRQMSDRSRHVLKSALTDIPHAFLCPITYEVMTEPVVCADGHTYEEEAIEEWLRHHDTSPVTNAVLPMKQTFPNYSLRSAIRDFVARAESVNSTVEHQDEQLGLLRRAVGHVQRASLKAILGSAAATNTTGGPEEAAAAAAPTTVMSVDDLMTNESAVRSAFSAYDTNKDGHLDAEEFRALFSAGAAEEQGSSSLSDEEIEQVRAMVDVDGNGFIELEEFLEWLFGRGQWQKRG